MDAGTVQLQAARQRRKAKRSCPKFTGRTSRGASALPAAQLQSSAGQSSASDNDRKQSVQILWSIGHRLTLLRLALTGKKDPFNHGPPAMK